MTLLLRKSLMMVTAIGLSTCGADAVQQCLDDEKSGIFRHEKNDDCGCNPRQCPASTDCFHGDCCDPLIEQENPVKCGCKSVCGDGQVCRSGQCCKPGTDPHCPLCDPLAPLNLVNDQDCGCRGKCPGASHCHDGICQCSGAGEVLCHVEMQPPWGECIPQLVCICDPNKDQTNAANCGCNGPCNADQRCVDGKCVCDPLAHPFDNKNCGCVADCTTMSGYTCNNGSCQCDPNNLANAANCGCTGPCKANQICDSGICKCDPNNQTNSQDCACKGPCAEVNQYYRCFDGACACPPEMYYNSQACACGMGCMAGQICDNGQCILPGL